MKASGDYSIVCSNTSMVGFKMSKSCFDWSGDLTLDTCRTAPGSRDQMYLFGSLLAFSCGLTVQAECFHVFIRVLNELTSPCGIMISN